ncbi:hypothetical protein EV356DRAFT_531250 [Viridothelium virens]|uniref:Transcription factor IIIC putative zinc-finger domain-containing protein n=1 Tax=Viridothelium virens TaxID=1048519 RepID=A0A6A6HEC1_VIRVR|nr:hypothetical protein EV356DRAFT_531250 [Viridothelium virens]
MALQQTVNFWPSAPDSIRWSKDYDLAIAAGEQVAILIPKKRKGTDQKRRFNLDNTTSSDDWHKLYLKTNAFTKDEVPILPPSSFNTWSIGEEQSLRKVVALDWSSIPIAKHQRYALGVLTSNHTLTIWASTSIPTETGSWQKVLIVNHVLDSYFPSENVDHGSWRLRRRIRSFAWSPRFYEDFQGLKSRIQYLAIANEYNEIIVVSIHAPHNILNPNIQSWSASVVFHFNISSTVKQKSTQYSSQLSHYIQEQKCASHLTWSPWYSEKGRAYSVLAAVSGGRLHLKRLKLSESAINARLTIDENCQMPSLPTGIKGPARWVPHGLYISRNNFSEKQLTLCTFSDSYLYYLRLNPVDTLSFNISTRNLDDRWDEISGLSFTQGSNGDTMLHFTSISSPVSSVASNFSLPLDTNTNQPILPWQQRIVEQQVLFSANHELDGHAIARNWGIAASPYGELMTTCISLHPTDQIHYAISAEQNSQITITAARGDQDGFYLARNCHLQDFGSEAILFSIRSWIQISDVPTENIKAGLEKYIDPALTAIGIIQQTEEDKLLEIQKSHKRLEDAISNGTPNDIDVLVEMVRAIMLATHGLREKAYRNLLRFIEPLNSHELAHEQDSIGICPLETIRSLPSRLYDGTTVLSQRFLLAHDSASAIFSGHPTGDLIFKEYCVICGSVIAFEDPFEARCKGQNVHRFVRCRMTFLAIQAPFITRQCGICAKQYLKEEFLAEDTPANRDVVQQIEVNGKGKKSVRDENPKISLARLLFAMCNKCTFCGGKFIG